MVASRPDLVFRPLEAPRVVHDQLSGGPVLLLGYWVNDMGYEIQAAVSTMVMPRPLHDLRPYPAASIFPTRREGPP